MKPRKICRNINTLPALLQDKKWCCLMHSRNRCGLSHDRTIHFLVVQLKTCRCSCLHVMTERVTALLQPLPVPSLAEILHFTWLNTFFIAVFTVCHELFLPELIESCRNHEVPSVSVSLCQCTRVHVDVHMSRSYIFHSMCCGLEIPTTPHFRHFVSVFKYKHVKKFP
jgi:hypothetical protein